MKQTIIILSSLVILLASCGSNGCEETRETFCMAQLTSTSGATINQLYAYGIGQGKGETDSEGNKTDEEMLSASSPQDLEFILNPDSTITDIRLQMTITLDGEQFQQEDTLHIIYDPYPYFIDMECGCSMFFTIEDVSTTKNFLRDVTIKRNEITNEQNINLIIEY